MDEVGRGTSTEDGLAIAWAVSEHLLNSVRCKTLFATHYHELTRLEHKALLFLCMSVAENGSDIVFMRKVAEGASGNSYGIHVARLAGVPEPVIRRAEEVLEKIQDAAAEKPVITSSEPCSPEASSMPQSLPLSLFSEEELVLSEIRSCAADSMTPLEALQALFRWKKSLSES